MRLPTLDETMQLVGVVLLVPGLLLLLAGAYLAVTAPCSDGAFLYLKEDADATGDAVEYEELPEAAREQFDALLAGESVHPGAGDDAGLTAGTVVRYRSEYYAVERTHIDCSPTYPALLALGGFTTAVGAGLFGGGRGLIPRRAARERRP